VPKVLEEAAMTFNVEQSGDYETNKLRPGESFINPWWALFVGADIDNKLAVAVRTDLDFFMNDPKYVSKGNDLSR
jgi:hypothetical protein